MYFLELSVTYFQKLAVLFQHHLDFCLDVPKLTSTILESTNQKLNYD